MPNFQRCHQIHRNLDVCGDAPNFGRCPTQAGNCNASQSLTTGLGARYLSMDGVRAHADGWSFMMIFFNGNQQLSAPVSRSTHSMLTPESFEGAFRGYVVISL